MAVLAAYTMGPPRDDPDPAIFVVVAVLTLGPSMMLANAVRRVRHVSLHWDLGRMGANILRFASLLTAAFLAYGGLYAVVRFVKLVWVR